MKAKILIVDDEKSVIFTLKEILRDYELMTFNKSDEAIKAIKSREQFDLLLIDFRMQGITGIDILYEAKKNLISYKAILITAFSYKEMLETIINNELVYRVVNKPIDPENISKIVREALIQLHKERKAIDYQKLIEFQVATLFESKTTIVHSCKLMQQLILNVKKCANSNANILIEGESGVGKEGIANLIHANSSRSIKPLIKINCSAIPEHLFESELFGYKKGAFTGASMDKQGKFQLANGGTLFLDEVGELPYHQQTKLLRAIENQEITALGSTECEKVDVRIISATNRNLEMMIKEGKFRSDLHYRLNVLNLYIPSLKERKEDIPLLAYYFLTEIANREGQIIKTMNKDAIEYLCKKDFNGNVRELKNLIYRIYVLTDNYTISKTDIENVLRNNQKAVENSYMNPFEIPMTLEELERKYIETQLDKNDYSITETAKTLGMEGSNLSRKLKNMGIQVKELKNISV